jgi:hypothetical protein
MIAGRLFQRYVGGDRLYAESGTTILLTQRPHMLERWKLRLMCLLNHDPDIVSAVRSNLDSGLIGHNGRMEFLRSF